MLKLVLMFMLTGLAFAIPAQAASGMPANTDADTVFVALRDAARANDATRAAELAARLPANFDLASYVEYYKLRPRLFEPGGAPRAQTPDAEVRAYLDHWSGEAIADRLRNDWLLALGKQRNASLFNEQYPQFALKDDPQVACYAQAFRMQRLLADPASGRLVYPRSEAVRDWLLAEARPALRDARQWTDGCLWLVESLVASRLYGEADLWGLVRLGYDQNIIQAGKRIAQWLPDAEPVALDLAAEKPTRWLSRNALKTPVQHQIALLAMIRLARTDPQTAADEFVRIAPRLTPPERAYAWGKIGEYAARRTMPEALAWFRQADAAAADADIDDETLRWQVRAALRAGDWAMVRRAIERMSTDALRDSTWVYWLARALQVDGETERSVALLRGIQNDYSFYGRLAREDLGSDTALPARARSATPDEIALAQANPGFARALRFYALDMRFEANREWNWQLRGMNDRQLLAAAEFAQRNDVLDRAIASAERTRNEHDFNLRFLMPYREQFTRKAAESGLDNAFVYGLVRQESRFVTHARSSVGASGLMQLMPTTAKWVARKIGLTDYHPGRVTDLDTNLQLGTNYLKMVLDDLDGSFVLASAAYNAGPSRPRQWRSTLTRPVEGAIFAETIPFTETRDYVKKVLLNAVYYAALLDGRAQSLKTRLGTIGPREAASSELP